MNNKIWNVLVVWFLQLGSKLGWILVLSLIIAPLSTYLHFFTHAHTEQAHTFVQYSWGFFYRVSIFILFLYLADAARYIFQNED
jgi:hypothetical protein